MTGRAAPLVLDLPRIRAAVTLPSAVAAVERALLAVASGQVLQPNPMGIDLPGGDVHVKAAQLGAGQPLVIKVATGFAGNSADGIATGDGAMLALDADTGQILAVLMDRGWLTDLRTAAATAVAVRLLSHDPSARMALLGTGVQADLTLRTLHAMGLLPGEIVVWGRTAARAESLATQHQYDDSSVRAVGDAEEAVRGADIVVTVTPSRTPILSGDWLGDDALVVAVGADGPGKRECDRAVLSRADHVIVDDVAQATGLGELQYAAAEGTRPDPPGRIRRLGDLLLQPETAPRSGIRLCDLTGLGAYDAAIAMLALPAG